MAAATVAVVLAFAGHLRPPSSSSQLTHRRTHSSRARPLLLTAPDAPEPQLSGTLLAGDCAALVVFGLGANSLKAFALAGSDLLHFGILMTIVVLAYSMMGHFVFGTSIKTFSTLGSSIIVCFNMFAYGDNSVSDSIQGLGTLQ